ncbi:MAG: DUF2189 domain-containing protein [Pseudomonadota bacterium]
MAAESERVPVDGVDGERTSSAPRPERVVSTIQSQRPAFRQKPEVRTIGLDDIRAALSAGVSDFLAAPQFGLFFGGVFVLGGFLLLGFLTVLEMPWMIIFLAVGFPLVGPFVAVGLYEVSRRRAAGEPLRWPEVLGVIVNQKDRQLAWMAFVVLFIFWIWAYQIRLLIALFLGLAPVSTLEGFVTTILSDPDGVLFLSVGTGVGAVLAFVLFSTTVLSMPMLVDKDVDIVTAIVTSVQAVLSNPKPMLAWGVLVTAAMMLALLPAFLGLLFVLPILGHATWRLYDRVVTWSEPA